MSQIKLQDLLSLYVIPAKTQDPAIQSIPTLRKVTKLAGASFPIVRTRGYLTDIALPEADGDLHFFIETIKNAHLHQSPMQTCEIQGLFKLGTNKKSSDPRLKPFKQLFAELVEVTGFLRVWPEHLRDSREPHLFELHPLLTIGLPGQAPLDFTDRVVWPTGEDEAEKARPIGTVLAGPAGLRLRRVKTRLVFATPSHGMKRENYIHVDGYCQQKPKSNGLFWQFQLFAGPQSSAAILCLALKVSGVGPKVAAMTPGRYEIGGLAGLNIPALTATTPAWVTQLAPVLSLKKLGH